MRVKEVLASLGLVSLGYLFLGLTMGWMPALYMIGTILGFWLIIVGFSAAISRATMHTDGSLMEAQAQRSGQMYVETAYAAKDHKDAIERGSDGEYIDT